MGQASQQRRSPPSPQTRQADACRSSHLSSQFTRLQNSCSAAAHFLSARPHIKCEERHQVCALCAHTVSFSCQGFLHNLLNCSSCEHFVKSACLAYPSLAVRDEWCLCRAAPFWPAGQPGHTLREMVIHCRKMDSAGRRSLLPACSSNSLQLMLCVLMTPPGRHCLHSQAICPS